MSVWWFEGPEGTANFTTQFLSAKADPDPAQTPYAGDFDGNLIADIFWYEPGAGMEQFWWGDQSRNFAKQSAGENVSGTYDIAVGRFDAGRTDDILFSRSRNGSDHIWLMGPLGNQYRSIPTRFLGASKPYSGGDFDSNTIDDIVWTM